MKSTEVKQRLYNIPEAAIYMSRSQWSIRNLIYKGVLRCVRIDRRVQVDENDMDELIEKSKE